MGFFDRNKKHDDGTMEEGYFDANVEEISLGGTPKAKVDPEPKPAAASTKQVTASYGIQQAIKLMRAIPITDDNLDQVVMVIKTTLESTNVNLPSIIEDADKKLRNLESEIQLLKDDITNFEAEITKRRAQITDLTTDHEETSQVKERLELAEHLAESKQGKKKRPKKKSEAPKEKRDAGTPSRPTN